MPYLILPHHMEGHKERLWDIAGITPSAFSSEGQGPLENFFLCVDGGLGENSHLWEFSGVVCAIVEGRLWITSWFIVVWLSSCGVVYSGCLGLSGFHQRSSWFTMWVAMSRTKFIYMFDVDYIEGTKSAYFRRCGVHIISIASTLH